MKAEIVIVKGAPPLKARFGAGRIVTIGRSKESDIQINSTVVSRLHCRIQYDGRAWVLTDLDSRNGTWFEGNRVTTHVLSVGDVFSLGRKVVIRFGVTEDETAGAKPEPEPEPAPDQCPFCASGIEPGSVTAKNREGVEFHKGCLELSHLIGKDLGGNRVIDRLPGVGPVHRFRAHQPALNRQVQLLAFDGDTASRPGFRDRLMAEVKNVSRLLHPNILQIHDFLEHDRSCLVAMEYYPGKTLEEILEKKKFVNVTGALSIASQLAKGLAYAEGEGQVTDRLKLSDVLVNEENNVKLDYFLPPLQRRIAPSDLTYLAPEVLSSRGLTFTGERPKEVGPAVKGAIYSVGAMLYHMLAGIPPFEGKTEEELLPKLVKESPTPLRKVNIKVSPALVRVVERAMDKDPAQRPDGFAALQADLKKIISPGL